MVEKHQVLAEIRRIAEANGGQPPGRERFEQESGIRIADWYPHLWLRWGDALQEAGFQPNQLATKFDSSVIVEKYISLIRELGRVPLAAELRVKARSDPSFPSHGVFANFGGKQALLAAVREHCKQHGSTDVVALLPPGGAEVLSAKGTSEKPPRVATGYVYLMKSGRHYKIGRTNSVGRREWELGIKIPIPPSTVHVIETDDPPGVEAYWHRRFADRRGEGEWFNLSSADITAFKRWRKIA
jgi:hypothetical protein